jgi:hypothetical protein
MIATAIGQIFQELQSVAASSFNDGSVRSGATMKNCILKARLNTFCKLAERR